jgi:hypothetical protein
MSSETSDTTMAEREHSFKSEIPGPLITHLTRAFSISTSKQSPNSRGTLITSLTLRKRNMTNAVLHRQLEVLIQAPLPSESPSTPIRLTTMTISSPLMHLVELDVSRNRLSDIPALLAIYCPLLAKLNCQCNLFSKIPDEVMALTNLRVLNLSQNRINGQIPDELAQRLPLLQSLKLDDNLITGTIPETMKRLTHLETLILGSEYGGNLISHIPDNVISGLKSLKELDLSHNRLDQLPEDVGWNESKLQRIRCNNNFLSNVPRSLGLCRDLKTLDLSHNNICSLPIQIADLDSLELLDLTDNYLCAVPYPVDAFMKRTTVLLTANPFTTGDDAHSDEREQHLAKLVEQRKRSQITSVDEEAKISVEYEDLEDTMLLEEEIRHLVEQRNHRETMSRLEEVFEEIPMSPASPVASFEQDFPMFSRTRRTTLESSTFEAIPTTIPRNYDVAVGQADGDSLGTSPRDSMVQRVPSPAVRARGMKPLSMDDLTPVPAVANFMPSLKELSARSILQNQLALDPASLPSHLLVYLLDGARPCSHCGNPYVKEYLAGIRTIKSSYHGMIPRKVRYCTTACAEAHLMLLNDTKPRLQRNNSPHLWRLNKLKPASEVASGPSGDIEEVMLTVRELNTLRRKSIAAELSTSIDIAAADDTRFPDL